MNTLPASSHETENDWRSPGRPLDTLAAIRDDARWLSANSANAMPTQYVLHDKIGAGGMATVHLALLLAPLGFSRVVAVKRLHPGFSGQPEFAAMLVDEARIAARVRHPNVVPTLDVFVDGGACLVMEYIEGESLANLLRSASLRSAPAPAAVVAAVMAGVLHGLHAAHTARSAKGELLNIMHRDVSPQNIMIGTDGVARIFDFGVAKARGRLQHTRVGEFKGKLPYMAPEQFSGAPLTQAIDIYSASVTLWEALTLRRLFDGNSEEEIFGKVLRADVPPPSHIEPGVPKALDAVVLRGLSRTPEARFASAEAMAVALESAVTPASALSVGAWVRELATEALAARARLVADVEDGTASPAAPVPVVDPSLVSEASRASGSAPLSSDTVSATSAESLPLAPTPIAAADPSPVFDNARVSLEPLRAPTTPLAAPSLATTTSEDPADKVETTFNSRAPGVPDKPSAQATSASVPSRVEQLRVNRGQTVPQAGWQRLRAAPVPLLILAPAVLIGALGWLALSARAHEDNRGAPSALETRALVTRIANAEATSDDEVPSDAPELASSEAPQDSADSKQTPEHPQVSRDDPRAPAAALSDATTESSRSSAKPKPRVPRRSSSRASTYLDSDPFVRRK